jgi:tetratricopeptide (TPR) repeat protein
MASVRIAASSERTLNRLIVGAVLLLVVGVPLIGAIYLLDRFVVAPPAIVDQKVVQLETAVREAPNNLSLRLRLAGAYTASHRYDEAVAQFDEVVTGAGSLKPEDAVGFVKTSHLGRGDALRLKGDLAGATVEYQAVVDLARDGEFASVDTELGSAWFALGSIALDDGRAADAVAALEAALVINRTDADTLHLLGRAYLAAGRADDAVASVRRAIQFVPIGWCEPYGTLAQAYGALGRTEAATVASSMAAFCANEPADVRPTLRGLTDGPAGLDARVALGLVAEVSGDSLTAADWYRQALALEPTDLTASSGLSRVTATAPAGPAGPAATSAPATTPAPTAPEGKG